MGLSRRRFLGGAAVGVGGTALYLLGMRRLGGLEPGAAPLGSAIPPSEPPGPVREYRLTARPADWTVGGAPSAPAWTYNGTVPGPELRVREGETLRVVLRNELPEATTIHWHGVPVPFAMDGVPDLTQAAVPPGQTFVYEFAAQTPGTYWYHTHVGYQLDRGLYGALIIEPRRESLEYDQEYTLVFDDWLLDPDHPQPNPDASGMMGMMGGRMGGRMRGMMDQETPRRSTGAHGPPPRVEPLYDTLIVNGKSGQTASELRVRRGDRVRLRLINAGSALPVAVRVAGHAMEVTHADGQPVVPRATDAVVLGMGERWDAIVEARNPGLWPITALAVGRKRTSVMLRYDGIERTTPSAQPDDTAGRGRALRYADLSAREPRPVEDCDREYDLELSGGMMDPSRWTINGRRYPVTDPLEARAGERVRIRLFNMSMMPHPMHLHGHFFQLIGVDGRRIEAPMLKDTVTVGHMEELVLDVVADNPGSRWLFHCHNIYHHLGGMGTELRYV